MAENRTFVILFNGIGIEVFTFGDLDVADCVL
jgi:hypothetical protein